MESAPKVLLFLFNGIFTGGISGIYGSTPTNMRLRLFGNINPFSRFGGSVYGDIGTVKDTRNRSDFLLGLGFDLNYRLIRHSPFSFGGVLSLPFDWHFRPDDPDDDDETHIVYLPAFSPRVGMLSEIMLSPSLDLVMRAELILSSILLDDWFYAKTGCFQYLIEMGIGGDEGIQTSSEDFYNQVLRNNFYLNQHHQHHHHHYHHRRNHHQHHHHHHHGHETSRARVTCRQACSVILNKRASAWLPLA